MYLSWCRWKWKRPPTRQTYRQNYSGFPCRWHIAFHRAKVIRSRSMVGVRLFKLVLLDEIANSFHSLYFFAWDTKYSFCRLRLQTISSPHSRSSAISSATVLRVMEIPMEARCLMISAIVVGCDSSVLPHRYLKKWSGLFYWPYDSRLFQINLILIWTDLLMMLLLVF